VNKGIFPIPLSTSTYVLHLLSTFYLQPPTFSPQPLLPLEGERMLVADAVLHDDQLGVGIGVPPVAVDRAAVPVEADRYSTASSSFALIIACFSLHFLQCFQFAALQPASCRKKARELFQKGSRAFPKRLACFSPRGRGHQNGRACHSPVSFWVQVSNSTIHLPRPAAGFKMLRQNPGRSGHRSRRIPERKLRPLQGAILSVTTIRKNFAAPRSPASNVTLPSETCFQAFGLFHPSDSESVV